MIFVGFQIDARALAERLLPGADSRDARAVGAYLVALALVLARAAVLRVGLEGAADAIALGLARGAHTASGRAEGASLAFFAALAAMSVAGREVYAVAVAAGGRRGARRRVPAAARVVASAAAVAAVAVACRDDRIDHEITAAGARSEPGREHRDREEKEGEWTASHGAL